MSIEDRVNKLLGSEAVVESSYDRGVRTPYYKKLEKHLMRKFGLSASEVLEVEKESWSSGGMKRIAPELESVLEYMNSVDLIRAISSNEQEFEDYAIAIGQA